MEFQFNGVNYYYSNTQLIWTAVALVIAVFAIAAYLDHRRRKTVALRKRFGTEYDRAVVTHGSAGNAEDKLADRTSRVKTLEFRELGVTERDRFVTEWHTVQSRFVDHPKSAVTEADDLIAAMLEARGYPAVSFEQRAADVSVSYPQVMENYRLAHGIAVRLGKVEATTEELRTAMIQFRGIFDELIQGREVRAQLAGAQKVAA